MLALTKRTEYALIAMCHLARNPASVVSARDMAEQFHVRLPLLMNVLKLLNKNRLLKSTRGASGGYLLAAQPGEITLGRLVAAVEGPVRLVKCAPGAAPRGENCELANSCPVRIPVLRVHHRFEQFMDTISIADLAFDYRYGALETAGTGGGTLGGASLELPLAGNAGLR
ncbi:MAG: Rrf2 family transcriptional regulator [Planctomycetes bacterium]|nr:Rrf2 family transcriptional regulator [Planctomycetota bacterium]